MDWTYKHDNENDTFSKLGLAAALIVNRIRNAQALRELSNSDKKQNEDRGSDPSPADADKERAEDQRRYVDQRLKSIAAWERKISGRKI